MGLLCELLSNNKKSFRIAPKMDNDFSDWFRSSEVKWYTKSIFLEWIGSNQSEIVDYLRIGMEK